MKRNIMKRAALVLAAVFAFPVSQSFALTPHTSAEFDAYKDETDATQKISTVTYAERQYETYAFIKGKNADKETIYGIGAVDQSGHFKLLSSGTSNSSLPVSGSWFSGTIYKLSGESTTYDKEFSSYTGSSAIAKYAGNDVTPDYIQLANQSLTMVVTGYDQFDLAILDNKGVSKGRYIKVVINGVEANNLDNYVDDDKKVYQYALNPDIESTIIVSDNVNSTSDQSKVGAYFSLRRIPQVVSAASVVVSGTPVTADVVSTTTVHFLVPYASDITNLTPDFTTITGGTLVGPTSAQDFTNSVTNPIEYTFKFDKDNDGNPENYLYKVTVEKIPASTVRTLDKLAYVIDGDTRYATISGNTVTVTLPYSYGDGRKNAAAKNSISTTIDFSDDLANAKLGSGTTVADGVAMNVDYSVSQSVVITSEDGNSTTYTINVVYEEPSTACDLLTFSLPIGAGKFAEGVINGSNVNVYMKSSDLSNSPFTPVYTTSPLSEVSSTTVIPMVFVKPNVLSKPFRVNAEKDGVFKDYMINVIPDDDAPIVVSVDKPTDLTAASLAGPLQLTFNEPVKLADGSANAGKISIKKKSSGTVVWSGVLTLGSDNMTGSTVFSGLEGLTDYTLIIESGSLTDLAGNELIYSLDFKTADGTLHTANLPYCTNMDGSEFEQPAFVVGPTYDSEASTRGAATSKNGAYRLAAGESLTLTAESVGTVDVIIFSFGQCNYNITAGAASKDGAITMAYDNDGVEEQLTVDSNTTTAIVITNTGTNEIMVPYISVSAVGTPAVTDKECNCK